METTEKQKPIQGEIKEYKLFDQREVRYDILNMTLENTPMMNPVAWELANKWEDGFYLRDDVTKGLEKQTLLQIKDNKIISAYRLQSLEQGKDLL